MKKIFDFIVYMITPRIEEPWELQARLISLCEKILVRGYSYSEELDEYREILREMYERDIKPEIKLKHNEKNIS